MKVNSTVNIPWSTDADKTLRATAVHKTGHLASMHIFFNLMGLKTVMAVARYPNLLNSADDFVRIASDYLARTKGMPAGTGKHAIVYTALTRFGASLEFAVAPNAESLITCKDTI